ncbi:hypothetical protein PUN28_019716 [Cardiocondyla obscurior]|uniref:Uncharacterized protein n=1 Tax=Cardiocondyla obscurior TaxID=286306 RepID=A0AAW2EA47_9HYME
MKVRHKHLPSGNPAGVEKLSVAKLTARRHRSLGSKITPQNLGLGRTLYEQADGERRPWSSLEEEGAGGRRKPPPKDASSLDSTTGPLVPRIIAVETFPPGRPLLTLQPKLEQPALALPPKPQPILPPLPQGLPLLALRPWAPCPLRLPPPQSTRPSLSALIPGDIRAYRLTSPRYRVPSTPRPLPVTQRTQTDVTPHAVQHAPVTTESGTQTDLWATTSASDSEPATYPGDEKWGP